MRRHFTLYTADGHTISVSPVGDHYDLHVRDEAGRTLATVTMTPAELDALRAEIAGVTK
ncbi:hypothetical protein HEK616_40760 [Streptomyces nigrescens]|uniref:Uncharacterized protein n=1 Tax=Streptomyces nigrescens TaxID=1920 RepID=A0ABM7ZW43_STRNI|nr:hypothetical protein [Streptomyces nigrescens]BDM70589.1 hypothetical protein HEK616_40760 [Streptomyces nigrescens]